MRAIEFETQVDADGRLAMPENVELPTGAHARVIVLLPEDDLEWEQFSAQAVCDYYSPEDSVYDDYPRG